MKVFRRFFPFFLMVLLASSMFVASPVAAADDFYEVSVVANEVVRLRGQQVTFNTYTNASSFRQIIIAPSGGVVYNQTRTTNMTFTVPAGAEYGMYVVRSVAGESTAETWLTVLDVQGWSSASFPYSRSWGNVDYTFFANGTVKAANAYDVLDIDLSTLRTVTLQYDLTVSPTSNSMNFRVRFSKASIAVDLTFSFIHAGCKFTVNGTLDQARTFRFNVENPARLKRMLDSVRSGDLVFDWGDLRRAAHAFSYVDGVLSVDVPQSFMLDPTLFSDGFESGNFSAWSNVWGDAPFTVEVSSTLPHHGTYSMKTNGHAGAWLYASKYGGAKNELYIRFYFYLPAALASGATTITLLELYNSAWGGTNTNVQIDEVSGAMTFLLSGVASGVACVANTWYCVETHYLVGNATTGKRQMWINGTLAVDVTAENTVTTGALQIGGISAVAGFIVYQDCYVLSDAYISPEQTTFTSDLTLTTPFSYIVATQWQALNPTTLTTNHTLTLTNKAEYTLIPQWTTPQTLNLQLQAAYNLAVATANPQTWTIALTTGVSYLIELAWQSSLSWLVDLAVAPLLALDALGFAVVALIFAVTAVGLVALVVFKRRED